jgi:hypothetical protein
LDPFTFTPQETSGAGRANQVRDVQIRLIHFGINLLPCKPWWSFSINVFPTYNPKSTTPIAQEIRAPVAYIPFVTTQYIINRASSSLVSLELAVHLIVASVRACAFTAFLRKGTTGIAPRIFVFYELIQRDTV